MAVIAPFQGADIGATVVVGLRPRGLTPRYFIRPFQGQANPFNLLSIFLLPVSPWQTHPFQQVLVSRVVAERFKWEFESDPR